MTTTHQPRPGRPLVSILIPTYNRASLLPQALDSVLAQTVGDFEIVVSSNHCTDETDAILEDYATRDARVRPVKPPQHLDSPRNFAFAYAQARGECVAFLSDDDTWEPRFLEATTRVLQQHPEIAACATGWTEWAPALNYRESLVLCEGGEIADLLRRVVDRPPLLINFIVFRHSALEDIGGVKPTTLAGDVEIYIRCAERGQKFWFVPEALGTYRIHEGASWTRMAQINLGFADLLNGMHFEDPEIEAVRRKRAAEYYLTAGRNFTDNDAVGQARNCFRRSLRLHPARARLWSAFALTLLPATMRHHVMVFKRRLHDSRRAAILRSGYQQSQDA